MPPAKPPPSRWHQALSLCQADRSLPPPPPVPAAGTACSQSLWVSLWWLPQPRPATWPSRSCREIPELEHPGAFSRLASHLGPLGRAPPD